MKSNAKLWTGAAAALVLLGVALYVWPNAIEAPTMDEKNNVDAKTSPTDYVKAPSTPPKQTTQTAPPPATYTSGIYGPYSAAKLANATRGPVILFFNSASCAACKSLDADIRAHISAIPRDVVILEVDFDTNAELNNKYGVTTPNRIVQVDKDGNRITQWGNSPSLSDLLTKVVRF